MKNFCPDPGCGRALEEGDLLRGVCSACGKVFEMPRRELSEDSAGEHGESPPSSAAGDGGAEPAAEPGGEQPPDAPVPASRGAGPLTLPSRRVLAAVLAGSFCAGLFFGLMFSSRDRFLRAPGEAPPVFSGLPGPDVPVEGAVPEAPEAPEAGEESFWEQYVRREQARLAGAATPAPEPTARREEPPFRLEPLPGPEAPPPAILVEPEPMVMPDPSPPSFRPPAEPEPPREPEPDPPFAETVPPRPDRLLPAPSLLPPPVAPARLTVESLPPGARVFLDGSARGDAPLTLEGLAPGEYVVRVESEGYLPAGRQVTLESGGSETLSLRLAPRNPPPEPWPVAPPREPSPPPAEPAPGPDEGFSWRGLGIGAAREDILAVVGRSRFRSRDRVIPARFGGNSEGIVFILDDGGVCREIRISEPGAPLPGTGIEVGVAEETVFRWFGQPIGRERRDVLDNLETAGRYFFNDREGRISYPDAGYRFIFDNRGRVSRIIVFR